MNDEQESPPLLPTLPPYASHEGIPFILRRVSDAQLTNETVAAIGVALAVLLPQRDFTVTSSGEFLFNDSERLRGSSSAWNYAARLESVARSER